MRMSSEYSDDDLKVPRRRRSANIVYVYGLVTILVWGCYLLFNSVNTFLHPQVTNEQIRHYLQEKFVTPDSKLYSSRGKIPLNLTSQSSGIFTPSYKSVQWIKTQDSIYDDKGTYLVKEENTYSIRSIVDDSYKYTLYNGSSFAINNTEYEINNLIASPDLSKAILKTDSSHHWRHSTFAHYWILDVKSGVVKPIFQQHNHHLNKLAVVSWSPDSTKIAFIYENNIYYQDLSNNLITQVTFDGSDDFFNGKPDWVYEEEIFSSDIVLWWSPSSDKIAYLKSNDSQVPIYSLQKFIQNNPNQDYPIIESIKYPKAGYSNPQVEVALYDLQKKQETIIDLNGKIDSEKRLITEVAWLSNQVLVKTSNRASDLIEIFLVNDNNESRLVRSDSTSLGWFEITENIVFVPKNESLNRFEDGYIDTIVDGGYNHLAYFSPIDSSNYQLLTSGNWEVVGGVNSFDINSNEIYFTSTSKSSMERHIHSVNLLSKDIKDITVSPGYYSGSFSSGSRYLLLNYQGPQIPYQDIIDLQQGTITKKLESNKKLFETLQKYELPENKFEVIDIIDEETGDIIKVNSRETLPLNFDSRKKYPVLFFVYGGPNSQLVNQRFSIDFSAAIAAELNCIVVTVDGRGTGFNNYNPQGSKFKFIVRDQLGRYEPLDQIAAAKYWSKKSYVDSLRIAIWGWSYGGFLTLKTLETDYKDSIFSFGVSVAPVTEWKLYDSVYTERYMRTPQENPHGYETASINNITNFNHVKRFFIAHGTGDDNVHYQNSLKLLDKFNQKGIDNYDFMIFPDSDHSISYHGANKIIYKRILQFFRLHFAV